MSEYLIFPMREDFLPDIIRIEQSCFSDPWPEEAFRAELTYPWSEFCLIHNPRSELSAEVPVAPPTPPVGFIICWMLVGELHILNLAVLPEHRRLGLARCMMKHALSSFATRGGGRVSLEVRVSNLAAQAFYTRFGFQTVGTRKEYYRNREDALVMIADVAGEPSQEGFWADRPRDG